MIIIISVMDFLNSPLFKFLEVGLWGVILFRAFNGIRIIIIDLFEGALFHKKIFYIFIIIAFLLWVIGSYRILSHINWMQ